MWSECRKQQHSLPVKKKDKQASEYVGRRLEGGPEDKQVQRGLPVGAGTGTVVLVSAQCSVVLWSGCG